MTRSCLLALALLAAATSAAHARSEKVLAYPRDQAWPAAVRFLVVDEHVKVTDKDGDAGYVVFEWKDDGKTWRGSMEVVPFEEEGHKVIRFVVELADRPAWLEIQMLNRLEKKLHVELGSPEPAPPPKEEPPPKKDGPGRGDRDKDKGKEGDGEGSDADGDAPKKRGPIYDGGPPISPTP